MSDIKFFVPKRETIPTDLRLYFDDVYVRYERIEDGFKFMVDCEDENKAMNIVKEIVKRIEYEQDELQLGVSWRTVSLEIKQQNERYKFGTIIEWKYRIRDSY